MTWTSPSGVIHQAEYDIGLSTLADDVSFTASASATGVGTAATTYDYDTFIFAQKIEDGSLNAKQATVTVSNNGGTVAVASDLIVTDLSNDGALVETVSISDIEASGSVQIAGASTAADAALVVAANKLLQARADLAGKLVDDAMARAKQETYAEALADAKSRLSTDLKEISSGEEGADLGPLDPDLSVLENLAINAAKVDGASDGQMGTTIVTDGNVTLNLSGALSAGESVVDTITVATQSGLIEISGSIEVGDTYRLTVDGYPVSYTVTADDVASGLDINGVATAFARAINADDDIKDILQASVTGGGAISLLPKVSGQPFIASVSAQNGESGNLDDNDATHTDVFATRDYTVSYTNDTGSAVSTISLSGLRVVGAEQVSIYAGALSAAYPDNTLLESQATLAEQLFKNAELIETFSENFLGLFESAIAKVEASYNAAVSAATDAQSELASAEAKLFAEQIGYDSAFDLAIDLKADAANAAADLAAITAELSVGQAAARAQANVGLELSLEDAADALGAVSALTFGAGGGENGGVEVSDAGVITYTAHQSSLDSISVGDSYTDTIFYSIHNGVHDFSVGTIEVTVTKTDDGSRVFGLEGITAQGAKQLAADTSASGLSASQARSLQGEVDFLLGTEAAPGLVREYVSAVSDALDGASGSVNLILETLGIAEGSSAAKSDPSAIEALSALAVAENFLAAANSSLSSLEKFEAKADAFADLADAIEATSGPTLQGLKFGPQAQAIDPAAIAQAMINSAREIAQGMA
ncbi:MAG: hypothetical protein VW907_05020, partial [Opitutae bacterium]